MECRRSTRESRRTPRIYHWGREQVADIRRNEVTIDTMCHDAKKIHAPVLYREPTRAKFVRRDVNITSEIINKANRTLTNR